MSEKEIEKLTKIIENVKPTVGRGIGDWKHRVAEAIYDAGYRLPVELKVLEDEEIEKVVGISIWYYMSFQQRNDVKKAVQAQRDYCMRQIKESQA